MGMCNEWGEIRMVRETGKKEVKNSFLGGGLGKEDKISEREQDKVRGL